MPELSKNCINCSIGLMLKLINWCAFKKTNFICDHENQKVKAETTKPVYQVPILILVVTTIALSSFYCANRTYTVIKENGRLYDVILTGYDLMLYIITILSVIQLLLRHDKIINAVVSIGDVLVQFETQTSITLLPIENVKSLHKRVAIEVTLICIGFFIGSISIFFYSMDPNWSIIEKFALIMCVYVCIMTIIMVLLATTFFYHLHRNLNNILSLELDNLRFSENNNSNDNVMIQIVRVNVSNILLSYSAAQNSLIRFLKFVNNAGNPLILIYILITTIFFIITLFLMVLLIVNFNEYSLNMKFVVVQCGMQCTIIGISYVIVQFAKTKTMNNEMVSVLRKFPLSMLTSSERVQFECVLDVLIMNQSDLHACEIVSFDIQLFASLFATVLTYTLVAIQFEFL